MVVNGCAFTFMGYAFVHCTAIPYLKNKNDGSIILKNYKDIFSILAWGKSGGNKDFQNYVQSN